MPDPTVPQILIVEDENSVARFLYQAVEEAGYSPTACGRGDLALELSASGRFDLIMLDLMLPGIPGLQICRELRRQGLNTPVLMLTARDSTEDKIAGLDAGADDYIVKPFALGELLARIRALLRRAGTAAGAHEEVLRVRDLVLEPAVQRATLAGEPLALSSTEFSLLEQLMRHRQRALTREELLEKVWQYDFGGDYNVLHVYISYLRRKLEKGGRERLIHTVRGVGYRLGGEQKT